MEQITAYKSSDGKVFQSEDLAKAHELSIEVRNSLNTTAVYGELDINQILDWIVKNKELIRNYLNLL